MAAKGAFHKKCPHEKVKENFQQIVKLSFERRKKIFLQLLETEKLQ